MCGCGCNTCETKGPLLTENKIKSLLSEGLTYHIENNIPLYESVYRIGSDAHLSLIKEARQLYSRNVVDLCEDDVELVKTHLGEFGVYKGEAVPLDLPMLNEKLTIAGKEVEKIDIKGNDPENWVVKYKDGSEEPYLKTLNENKSDELLSQILKVLQNIEDGDDNREEDLENLDLSIDYLASILSKKSPFDIEIDQKQLDRFAQPTNENKENPGATLGPGPKAGPEGVTDNYYVKAFKYKLVPKKIKGSGLEVKQLYESRISTLVKEIITEKKKKKKDPPLGKPKRGGPKAYYVYVRDPKTKKIKKVTFGSGGLRAKIKNKKARNAFAKRHNCKNKKDRTKASYWSCNLPRYASRLGLGANMNTFW